MTPEGYEKRDLKAWFDAYDGIYHFWPVQTGYGKTTIDCLACINGRFWMIEVKAPGESPTARQLEILREGRAAGAKCVWGTFEMIRAHIVDSTESSLD